MPNTNGKNPPAADFHRAAVGGQHRAMQHATAPHPHLAAEHYSRRYIGSPDHLVAGAGNDIDPVSAGMHAGVVLLASRCYWPWDLCPWHGRNTTRDPLGGRYDSFRPAEAKTTAGSQVHFTRTGW